MDGTLLSSDWLWLSSNRRSDKVNSSKFRESSSLKTSSSSARSSCHKFFITRFSVFVATETGAGEPNSIDKAAQATVEPASSLVDRSVVGDAMSAISGNTSSVNISDFEGMLSVDAPSSPSRSSRYSPSSISSCDNDRRLPRRCSSDDPATNTSSLPSDNDTRSSQSSSTVPSCHKLTGIISLCFFFLCTAFGAGEPSTAPNKPQTRTESAALSLLVGFWETMTA
mmetsp:Transcript_8696/g.19519  ORF Transcript_8696/g.19519 Transcript_8696/m.19519 type:complete len:225 (-) Transcript_8696:1146-1820(-)